MISHLVAWIVGSGTGAAVWEWYKRCEMRKALDDKLGSAANNFQEYLDSLDKEKVK